MDDWNAESYALDDNDAPMPMECDICGTKDFYLESGFYYCSLCNTQSQQTRQYVDEQDFAPERQFAIRRTGQLKDNKRISVSYKDQPLYLSNWEVNNLIIKGMTDKLISLGFPKTLRAKVFQIWSFYLTKRRAVFSGVYKGLQLHPAVSLREPKMNLYSIHNVKPKFIRRMAKRTKVIAEEPTDEMISVSQSKKKKSLSKRKAMESEYRVEAEKRSKEDDAYDIVTQPNKEVAEAPEVETEEPPHNLTKLAKKARTALKHKKTELKLDVEYENKAKPPGFSRGLKLLKVERFTLKNVLILLFVALRQIGCKVVFSDLMRMLRDGTLYVQSLKLLLHEDELKFVSGNSVRFLISVYRFDNAIRCADDIEDFIQYVGLKHFRYPQFEEILPKIIDELALPREFECLVIQMNKLFSMEDYMNDQRGKCQQWRTMVEIWVLSTIGVALKMMFGLDDVTEKYQSQFARAVNKILIEKSKKSSKSSKSNLDYKFLFVLDDWFKYTETRNTIVKHELFNAQMYDPDQTLNLAAVNNLMSRYGGNRILNAGIVSRSKDNAMEMLKRITMGKDGVDDIATVADYLTIPLPKETVMNDYRKLVPNVCYPEYAEAELLESFEKHRIDYVIYPERYFPLLKKKGYTVKMFSGDANMYKGKIPKGPKDLVVFKPYKSFDDYIGVPNECSESLKYLINLFTDIAIGADKSGGNKPLFHMILTTIGDLTCRKCLASFIPMSNYENLNYSLKEKVLENPQRKFAWVNNLKRKK